MTLFVILICLALQYFFDLRSASRDRACRLYVNHGQALLSKLQITCGWLRLILLLLPILLGLTILNELLHDVWFNSIQFVLNVVVLFYCLDARNQREALSGFFNAYEQDSQQTAFEVGQSFVSPAQPADLVNLIRSITRTLFLRASHGIFSVIFWYVILGSVGAALYALVNGMASMTLSGSQLNDKVIMVAQRLRNWLDWLPNRVVGFSYALVGHFTYAFRHFCEKALNKPSVSAEFAADLGEAALELDPQDLAHTRIEENQQALDLIHKAVILWLAAIAVFTLVAWIS